MILESLNIKNYRNFHTINIVFHNSINVIVGKNAQGKTNLIEAIYFLLKGESFRFGKINDLINYDNCLLDKKAYLILQLKKKKWIIWSNQY